MAKKEPKVQITDLDQAQCKVLADGLRNAVVQLTFQADTKTSYKDFIDQLADELGIEPADIKKAATVIYKQSFRDQSRKQSTIEQILHVTGNLPEEEDDE